MSERKAPEEETGSNRRTERKFSLFIRFFCYFCSEAKIAFSSSLFQSFSHVLVSKECVECVTLKMFFCNNNFLMFPL